MSEKHKLTQSEIDGVQYRRAKLWQIILYACNGLVGMSVYSLIGLASYSASIGYGISTIIVGYILTGTRIFDAITDPMVAFLYDRINTKFGKLRILLAGDFSSKRCPGNVRFCIQQRIRHHRLYPSVLSVCHRLHDHKYDGADHPRSSEQ